MPTNYGVIPYRPDPGYGSRGYGYGGSQGLSIADILLRGGAMQAQAEMQRGQILGDTFAGIGQTVGTALQQRAEQKRLKAQESAYMDFLGDPANLADPAKAVRGVLGIFGPGPEGQAQVKALGGYIQLMAGNNDPEKNAQAAEDMIRGVMGRSPQFIADSYPELYKAASKVPGLAGLPAAFNAETAPKVQDIVGAWLKSREKPHELGTKPPTEDVYDKVSGRIVTPGTPEPPKPQPLMNVGGTVYDPNARKPLYTAPREGPQTNYQPRLVMVDGKEVQANYDPRTGKFHDVDTGAVLSGVAAPPTADMRNKSEGRRFVARSIDAIKNLSERVITKRGIAQRAVAAGRTIESVLGGDPEFRTYQDARTALAGNLAVAQQGSRPSDADIKAVWLPLVPDVFRDTDESAKMKWDLIQTMSLREGEGAPPTSGGAPVRVKSPDEARKLPSGTLFQTPDGRIMRVP